MRDSVSKELCKEGNQWGQFSQVLDDIFQYRLGVRMYDALLGPTFDLKITPAQKFSPEDIFILISDPVETKEKWEDSWILKTELKELFFDAFLIHFKNLVSNMKIPHDGFDMSWNYTGVYSPGDDEEETIEKELIVTLSINVNCKDEDFDPFDDIMNSEMYEESANKILVSTFRKFVQKYSSKNLLESVYSELGEFGYG